MNTEMKSLSLYDDEDSWYCGLPLDNQTEFTADLFNLLEEKMTDSSVLSLPWTPFTEVRIDRIDINSENSVTVRIGVTADFGDIDSFCKACENSENSDVEFVEQVKAQIHSIRQCT